MTITAEGLRQLLREQDDYINDLATKALEAIKKGGPHTTKAKELLRQIQFTTNPNPPMTNRPAYRKED